MKSPLRSEFETVARRGSCVRVFEHNVTLDIGLWQFRRGRKIAWCCCFPEDQHHTHLITWHTVQLGDNEIMFYDKDGRRAFRVAPYDAWDCYNEQQLNHLASEWRRWQDYLADPKNVRLLDVNASRSSARGMHSRRAYHGSHDYSVWTAMTLEEQIGVAIANGPLWNAFHIGPSAIGTPDSPNGC
jgi:hypothetical protein